MTAEARNFRSHYYEKVGFRGVEGKKSLQILLNDDPVDLEKLETFCVRFPIPVILRQHVWKLVLGVLPPHLSAHEYVWCQRRDQYNDLYHALKVMSIIDDETPANLVFLKLFLLEQGKLPLEDQLVPENNDQEVFMNITTSVLNMHETDLEDCYWITTKFYQHLQEMKCNLDLMPKKFQLLLQKEDPVLYNYLSSLSCLDRLPYADWFQGGFAGIIPPEALARIWDRLLGGACKLLLYVALTLIIDNKKHILTMSRSDKIKQCLQKVSSESADVIVNEAIDTWEKSGSHLSVT